MRTSSIHIFFMVADKYSTLVCFGLYPLWYSCEHFPCSYFLYTICCLLHQFQMDWAQRDLQAYRLQPAARIHRLELVPCLPCRPPHHICEFISFFVLHFLFSNLPSHDGEFRNLCSGSPVFWIGIGVALSAAFSMVRNSASCYALVYFCVYLLFVN